MTRELIGFIGISSVFLIALAIFLFNKNRRRKQELIISRPNELETGDFIASGLYASTVLAESALDRIWAHGLGARGKVSISASPVALSFDRVGEAGFSIPKTSLVRVSKASATIDKGVEKDGLLAIEWTLGGKLLLTNLRFADFEDSALVEHKISGMIGEQVG